MDIRPQIVSLSTQQEQLDAAHEQLKIVSKQLQEEKKILNRDWPDLTPRERSALSRQVKELEQRQQALMEEIEMNSAG
jgi:uncharacterized protein (DUF3084 family)